MTTTTAPPELLLQRAREDAGLSREALARRVGVSVSTIQRMELNSALPKSRVLFLLARELDVSPIRLAEAVLAELDPEPGAL